MITTNYKISSLSPTFGNSRTTKVLSDEKAKAVVPEKKIWLLIPNGPNSKFYYARTKQEYGAPFKVVKHFKQLQLSIQMKNSKGKTISFPISCSSSSELSEIYRTIRQASGYPKLNIILKALERQVLNKIF